MTEPKDGASDAPDPNIEADATEPPAVELPEDAAVADDPEAARAEAEAAALAANEVDVEDDLPMGEADDGLAGDELDDDADGSGDELVAEGGAAAAGSAGAATAEDRRSGRTAREARAARAAAATGAIPIDPSIRVRDNASKLFVIGTVAVFALIFLNGMLLGTGGVFRPYVSPSPSPSSSASVPASVAPSVAPSSSARASGSPASSGSARPSASVPASAPASPAASGSPAPS